MSLRRKLAFFQHTSWLLLLVHAALAAAASAVLGLPLGFTLVVAIVVFYVVTRTAPRALVGRAQARFLANLRAEDFPRARAVLEELLDAYRQTPRIFETLRISEAGILANEGRYAEACALLESLDRRLLAPETIPPLLNGLAWSMAHSGRTADGVRVAREALDSELPKRTRQLDDLRASILGTLGAALVLDGQPADAITPLEQALARGGLPTSQATRAFYLGEALRALGRNAEAVEAYRRAAETAPENKFGARAKTQLDALHPYR